MSIELLRSTTDVRQPILVALQYNTDKSLVTIFENSYILCAVYFPVIVLCAGGVCVILCLMHYGYV